MPTNHCRWALRRYDDPLEHNMIPITSFLGALVLEFRQVLLTAPNRRCTISLLYPPPHTHTTCRSLFNLLVFPIDTSTAILCFQTPGDLISKMKWGSDGQEMRTLTRLQESAKKTKEVRIHPKPSVYLTQAALAMH